MPQRNRDRGKDWTVLPSGNMCGKFSRYGIANHEASRITVEAAQRTFEIKKILVKDMPVY
jgi:hypothetical protein